MLVGEEFASTAHASLDLVQDKEEAVAITEFPQSFEVTRPWRHHTTFSLNRFDKDSDRPLRDCRFHSAEIIIGHITKPFEQRREALTHFLLAGRRDGGHGAAMKRAERRQDFVTALTFIATKFAGELNRRFIGLGAAVAKENLVSERISTQQLGQTRLRDSMVQVRDVRQRCHLFLYCLDDSRMALAEVHYC